MVGHDVAGGVGLIEGPRRREIGDQTSALCGAIAGKRKGRPVAGPLSSSLVVGISGPDDPSDTLP